MKTFNFTDGMNESALVDEYNRTGYLVINDVISVKELEELREICESEPFKAHWAKLGYAKDHAVFHQLTTEHPVFMNLAKHPAIVKIVTSLLGGNIQLHHSKLVSKPSSKTSVAKYIGWHRDFTYFPHTNADLLAVMVMLDDATPENGCMRMVRGSHKNSIGMLERRPVEDFIDSDPDSDDYIAQFPPEDIVSIEPKAGGISIHHSLTVHGSTANRSGKPRRGLVFQYRADDCYQLAGLVGHEAGILVSGNNTGVVRCDLGNIYVSENSKQPLDCHFSSKNSWCQNGSVAEGECSQDD